MKTGSRKNGTGIFGEINKIAGEDGWCNKVLICESMVEEMINDGCTAEHIYKAALSALDDL